MEVYFLRHGIALDRTEWHQDDRQRPLTEEGIARMTREAKTLDQLGLGLDAIITSPLTRARQTAEIVAAELGLQDKLEEDERLGLRFALPELREVLTAHAAVKAIMLVGHEPSFSDTISRLIGGARLECKKGGLARVDISGPVAPEGILQWLLPPRVLAP